MYEQNPNQKTRKKKKKKKVLMFNKRLRTFLI